ncbi:MAG: hypothetical protein U0791_08545 [Gemmataceae bacterium]
MGSMAFALPATLPPAADSLLRLASFAAGYDHSPSPTRVRIENGLLHLSRDTDESGSLFLPWPVGSNGAVVTTTSTLRERAAPYRLLVELARGKVNQLRTQTGKWQGIGLETPPEFNLELAAITSLFAKAALEAEGALADDFAAQALHRAHLASDRLARLYIEQVFATRLEEEGKLPTRLAARVLSAPAQSDEYRRTFNAARIGIRWREVEPVESTYNWSTLDMAVESARLSGLPITIGPVIDLAPGMTPAWADGWHGDLQTQAAFMCDFLETLISRYKDHVHRWVVCSGFNHADGAGLSDDERLRLMQRLFESAQQIDSQLELVLGVAQPWGDYMTQEDQTISPLSFADDLIRAGLNVSGVELEFRCGTTPRGSLPRDLLDLSKQIDMFSLLGLPLEVLLSHPASAAPDFGAREHGESLWDAAWPNGPTSEVQADWGAAFAAMALCKHEVRAVTWDHWSDADPHIVPSGGLVTASGKLQPLLARLEGLRAKFLE